MTPVCDTSLRREGGRLSKSAPRHQLDDAARLISSILGAGGQGGPGDSELKQHWLPDAVSRECYHCGDKFTTFRRRHHCRICSQIFCCRCCSQVMPGKVVGYSGDLRVCTDCSKVVRTYVHTITSGADD